MAPFWTIFTPHGTTYARYDMSPNFQCESNLFKQCWVKACCGASEGIDFPRESWKADQIVSGCNLINPGPELQIEFRDCSVRFANLGLNWINIAFFKSIAALQTVLSTLRPSTLKQVLALDFISFLSRLSTLTMHKFWPLAKALSYMNYEPQPSLCFTPYPVRRPCL